MKKATKSKTSYAPVRIYTDKEIDQFIKDDQIPPTLAKKINKRFRKTQNKI